MASNTTGIQTGVETPERAEAAAVSIDPDVWSYAIDGEFATRWAVKRLDETTVQVEIHRHKASLNEVDIIEQRAIDTDEATAQWALACATLDPSMAIEAAIEFFRRK